MSSTPTANIYTILTHYALKQNNPLIHFNEFSTNNKLKRFCIFLGLCYYEMDYEFQLNNYIQFKGGIFKCIL